MLSSQMPGNEYPNDKDDKDDKEHIFRNIQESEGIKISSIEKKNSSTKTE